MSKEEKDVMDLMENFSREMNNSLKEEIEPLCQSIEDLGRAIRLVANELIDVRDRVDKLENILNGQVQVSPFSPHKPKFEDPNREEADTTPNPDLEINKIYVDYKLDNLNIE